MSESKKPDVLSDADLDATGGVYIQEIPSGVTPRNNTGVVLFFDEADSLKKTGTDWAVFEPNNHR